MRRLSTAASEHVLLESTRVYLEKMISDLVTEDLKDPEIRARLFRLAGIDYKKAKRKLGFPRSKRKSRAKR